jgi:hypothetical protein
MLGTVWKRWNWLEEGLIPLAATLMHAAWAYPLFSLFMRNTITGEQNPGFTFWLCFFVLLGGVIAGKLAVRNRMGVVIVAVGGLTAIFVALLLTVPIGDVGLEQWGADLGGQIQSGSPGAIVPIPFVVVFSVAFLWWRGVRIASEEHTETIASFAAGVIALIGLFLLSRILPSSLGLPPSKALKEIATILAPMAFVGACLVALSFAVAARAMGEIALVIVQLAITIGVLFLALVLPVGPSMEWLGGWSLLFIAAGLITLALNGVLQTLRGQTAKTGVIMRVDRYWAMTVIGVVAVVLVVGLLVGQIISPGMIAQAFAWLRPIWRLLGRVVMFVIFVLAYLFFGLLGPLLEGLQQRAGSTEPRTFQSPVQMDDLQELARNPMQIPPIVGQILRTVLIVGGVALLIWLFVRAVKKRSEGKGSPDEVLETRENILSLDLVRSQLNDLLGGLRGRRAPPMFVQLDAAEDARQLIRELYQKVLARAVALDVPRKREQTPTRYQDSLLYLCSSESAEMRQAVETLTAAYEVARYGVEPPTADQVRAAQDAFAVIDAKLRSQPTS